MLLHIWLGRYTWIKEPAFNIQRRVAADEAAHIDVSTAGEHAAAAKKETERDPKKAGKPLCFGAHCS